MTTGNTVLRTPSTRLKYTYVYPLSHFVYLMFVNQIDSAVGWFCIQITLNLNRLKCHHTIMS